MNHMGGVGTDYTAGMTGENVLAQCPHLQPSEPHTPAEPLYHAEPLELPDLDQRLASLGFGDDDANFSGYTSRSTSQRQSRLPSIASTRASSPIADKGHYDADDFNPLSALDPSAQWSALAEADRSKHGFDGAYGIPGALPDIYGNLHPPTKAQQQYQEPSFSLDDMDPTPRVAMPMFIRRPHPTLQEHNEPEHNYSPDPSAYYPRRQPNFAPASLAEEDVFDHRDDPLLRPPPMARHLHSMRTRPSRPESRYVGDGGDDDNGYEEPPLHERRERPRAHRAYSDPFIGAFDSFASPDPLTAYPSFAQRPHFPDGYVAQPRRPDLDDGMLADQERLRLWEQRLREREAADYRQQLQSHQQMENYRQQVAMTDNARMMANPMNNPLMGGGMPFGGGYPGSPFMGGGMPLGNLSRYVPPAPHLHSVRPVPGPPSKIPDDLLKPPNVPPVPLGTGFHATIPPLAPAPIGFGVSPLVNSLDVHPAGNNGRARFSDAFMDDTRAMAAKLRTALSEKIAALSDLNAHRVAIPQR